MGQSRSDLQTLLEALLTTSNVYYQPPASVQMQYPAIVYNRDDIRTTFADNKPYRRTKRYAVTVIDPDPDSAIPDLVAALPSCIFDRNFVKDNLNQDVFVLY